MKKQLILIIVMILAAGCSQKERAGTIPTPSPSVTAAAPEVATDTPGAAASPHASPSGTGITGGGAGTAGTAPSGGTAVPEKMVSITKAQVDKLGPTSTYNDLVKIVGNNVKPIKEGSGKKTYELKISDETNLFVDLTYFSDGKISEKSVFKK